MRRFCWQPVMVNSIVFSAIVLGWTNPAVAQRRPIADDTLGSERSRVVPLDPQETSNRIEGGAQRGGNLFHSFREFGVDAGRSVYFADPGADNIFTRVTGGVASQILGVLGVQGNANLFLLNPSGIVFGENARLDVRGSFLATTADAIAFPSGDVFSASNPTAPTPLLNVNPNALLFNQLNPQPIINRANTSTSDLDDIFGDRIGLAAAPGQTLALVGGNVRLDNGRLTALGGRVELGGLSEPGAIGLRMNGNIPRLEFPDNAARSDVSLVKVSEINVEAGGGGSVALTTRNLNLNRSRIFAGIEDGLGTVDSQAGDIEVNATGSIALVDADISNRVGSASTGRGGDIRITTGTLSLTNDAGVSTGTFGRGDAGDIRIDARDTVSFDGAGALISPGASSEVGERGIGRGGDIRITTGTLSLTNGALLDASTFGRGTAGDIIIAARNTVSFDGILANDGFPSGAYSRVEEGGIGRGGNITITTGALSLTNGALLDSSTDGRGDAGDIIINARDTVSFDGRSRRGEVSSRAFSTVNPTAIGEGGDITVITGALALTDGARLSASSSGRGGAGNIRATAPQVQLDQGSITSETRSGDGGNIDLTVPNTLLLRRGSFISTTAGTAQAGGNGGNITIDAAFIVALPNDNSDITANAFSGSGGNVGITTEGLFGIAAQAQDNPLTNDITASSQQGVQGTVEITTPDTDPSRGLTELPAEVVDASNQISQTCSGARAGEGTSEFIVTGRGGLPISPTDPLVGDDSLAGWSTLDETESAMVPLGREAEEPAVRATRLWQLREAVVEAQGWVMGEDGTTRLIAAISTKAAQLPTSCHRDRL